MKIDFILQLVSCGMRHLFDKDDPSSAIPAALVASIAFASYPDTTVALYVMWKMLQVSDNSLFTHEPSIIRRINSLLECFSCRTILAVMLATCRKYRTSHFSFIAQARRHCSMRPHSNRPIYVLAIGNSCTRSLVDGKLLICIQRRQTTIMKCFLFGLVLLAWIDYHWTFMDSKHRSSWNKF